MTKKTRNWLIALCILALPFSIFLGFLISDLVSPLPPTPPLPKENGYDDFVKAGKMLASNTSGFYKMNEQELQTLVDGNSNALQLARSGLQKQCQVPLQFSTNYLSAHLEELANLKVLSQALVAEGQLAEMQNRTNDAAKSYSDAINLGIESRCGGVLLDQLVGIAIEAIGTSYLQKIANSLDVPTSRKTIAALETFDSQRQPWNEVMQEENVWHKAVIRLQKKKISKVDARKLESTHQSSCQTCEL
jgi:hypothetical protein